MLILIKVSKYFYFENVCCNSEDAATCFWCKHITVSKKVPGYRYFKNNPWKMKFFGKDHPFCLYSKAMLNCNFVSNYFFLFSGISSLGSVFVLLEKNKNDW